MNNENLSAQQVKLFASLLHKKFRHEHGLFIAEGENAVFEGLVTVPDTCERVIATKEYASNHPTLQHKIDLAGTELTVLDTKSFAKLCDAKTPQGILGVFAIPTHFSEELLQKNQRCILYLDKIADPGNLGTIIRTADWFGFRHILLSETCADPYAPKVVRSTAGSLFRSSLYREISIATLERFIQKGYTLTLADIKGVSPQDAYWGEKNILSVSNESAGPSVELSRIAKQRISVPGSGITESLNVASAASILLYEAFLKLR